MRRFIRPLLCVCLCACGDESTPFAPTLAEPSRDMYVGFGNTPMQSESSEDEMAEDLPLLAPPPATPSNEPDPVDAGLPDANTTPIDVIQVDAAVAEAETVACADTCVPEETTCLTDTSRGVCEDLDGDGCSTWTERLCPTGQSCFDGECAGATTPPPRRGPPMTDGRDSTPAPDEGGCVNVKTAQIGFNQGVTNSPGQYQPKDTDGCEPTDGSDDIWQFTAPGGGDFMVELYGGFTDFVIHARYDCEDIATEVGCVDEGGRLSGETVMMTLEPGRAIYLIVDTYRTVRPQRYELFISPL
ncbi:MAG: hypothetical protein VX589_18450 [Myxococcota bacterium]|nr:hypothetical protein [Myxococcota bacterium]